MSATTCAVYECYGHHDELGWSMDDDRWVCESDITGRSDDELRDWLIQWARENYTAQVAAEVAQARASIEVDWFGDGEWVALDLDGLPSGVEFHLRLEPYTEEN